MGVSGQNFSEWFLTSFFPEAELPSSRLAPEDKEPCDSLRPSFPEKAKATENIYGNHTNTHTHTLIHISFLLTLTESVNIL